MPGELPMTEQPVSIKGTGCKFGGWVRKVVEVTSADLRCVAELRLKVSQGTLISRQKSAESDLLMSPQDLGCGDENGMSRS